MEFIRVFTNPKRCMQRLGFLKPLVWQASRTATNNLSTLGNHLIESVSQKVSVILTPQLQEYIKVVLTDTQRRAHKRITSKPLGEELEEVKIQLELQDVLLSNSDLPSKRGKLVKEDWGKYPYLALNLGLVRKGTYSLLVRGQSFLSLVGGDEIGGFGRPVVKEVNGSVNPLLLTIPQKLLLVFAFIEGDGDVLKLFYKRLLQTSEGFADREVGGYLPEIYRVIIKENRSKARSGDDLLRIQRLLDTANKIERWTKTKPTGSKDILMESVTPRLEPFVDIGLLSKPDPFVYRYRVTDATRAFIEPLINAESIDNFIQHSFFEATNKGFSLHGKHQIDRETILPAIQKAYDVLKSPLGYAPILEVALLAGIYSITEMGNFFEISEAMDALKSLQKERSELVRFNVDRWGVLTFVKFSNDIKKLIEK
jgi:hypothetical protein